MSAGGRGHGAWRQINKPVSPLDDSIKHEDTGREDAASGQDAEFWLQSIARGYSAGAAAARSALCFSTAALFVSVAITADKRRRTVRISACSERHFVLRLKSASVKPSCVWRVFAKEAKSALAACNCRSRVARDRGISGLFQLVQSSISTTRSQPSASLPAETGFGIRKQ